MTTAAHRCTCPAGHDVAAAWRRAVVDTPRTPIDTDLLGPELARLTDVVLGALRRDDPDDADGTATPAGADGTDGADGTADGCRDELEAAGAALVRLQLTDPDAIERTLATLGRELGGCPAHPRRTARLPGVLGALAAGYARQLRRRTLDEQDLIATSAFAARAAAERARWDSEARFEAVFADAAVGIAVCDVDGTVLESNRTLRALIGHGPGTLPFWAHAHPDDPPDVWDRVRDLVAGTVDHVRLEKPLRRPDGSSVWTEVTASLIRTPQGAPRYLVAMINDVTAYREMRRTLAHQAYHDPLTGLANRALFFERLESALAADEPVGLCYLDLDGFKAVNDTLGHDHGDVLLRTIADRLHAALSPAGHLVARTGGDEFVVLTAGDASDGTLDDAAATALRVTRRPVRLADREIAVSSSIGMVCRSDGADAAALMKAADATMYWAKRDGGDRVARFDDARHRRELNRSALASRLTEAMALDEFAVEYQPLVRLADGGVAGVEALVRWALPSGEVLGPGEFIGLAEQTGAIVELGRSVLHRACRDAAAWRAADPRVAPLVSVNIAARQLREPGLLGDVFRILDDTGWPARLLQLELTENALLATTAEAVSTLRALADRGVRIAIDDFGTDYSNLAYLRHLPIDTLKLAGQFVNGDPYGPVDVRAGDDVARADVDLAVVDLVVQLAHVLRIDVTAEWVETEQQRAQLLELGCDLAQGWYFAPPVPADRVPGLVLDPPWVTGTVEAASTASTAGAAGAAGGPVPGDAAG